MLVLACTGTTHAESKEVLYNTAQMDVWATPATLTTITALTTPQKDVLETACTGTTHAEFSKTWLNTAQMDALTTTAQITTVTMETAPIMHTNFVLETTYIGTTHAELSKIYTQLAVEAKHANMDNVLIHKLIPVFNMYNHKTLTYHITEQPAMEVL